MVVGDMATLHLDEAELVETLQKECDAQAKLIESIQTHRDEQAELVKASQKECDVQAGLVTRLRNELYSAKCAYENVVDGCRGRSRTRISRRRQV